MMIHPCARLQLPRAWCAQNVSNKEVVGETFGGFVRLRAVVGAFYWVSLDGMRVLRGGEPGSADELQDGFIEAMARAGSER